ncbi:hypothetical protein F5J12DRAFT_825394 [Pisolithus orientalis]|uniref:uncharacterized protein n=1 Tax=Pisolithus orientalis TaxID=936130 RepID=UPI0022245F72|nr:uncharacterized protein F5J12DRAFT_825394 [Pisolithus orientalis]KAI6008754.1 hypothetical protein F5J12DRAFT_825394 [Pisolithus orientalis]
MLCVINTAQVTILPPALGTNFYSSLAFNPSGAKVVWQEWFHAESPRRLPSVSRMSNTRHSFGRSHSYVSRNTETVRLCTIQLGRKGGGWRTSKAHMSARICETRNTVDGGLTTSNDSPKTMSRRGKSIASIR